MSHARVLRTVVTGVLLVSLALLGVAGCGSGEPETISPDTPGVVEPGAPDEGQGGEVPETDTERALVESKCSGCHNLDRVWAASKDAAGWESTVRRMEANGLQLSDDERATIVTYLASQ